MVAANGRLKQVDCHKFDIRLSYIVPGHPELWIETLTQIENQTKMFLFMTSHSGLCLRDRTAHRPLSVLIDVLAHGTVEPH